MKMVGKECARKKGLVKMRSRLLIAVAGFSILLILQAGLQASIILSEFSSSPGLDPSFLDAEVIFGVVGSILTISFENLTPGGDDGYNVREIYFNATSNVTGLVLDNTVVGGINETGFWELLSSPPVLPANGYGSFDYALKLIPVPPESTNFDKNKEIDGEEDGVFTLTASGAGIAPSNFETKFSALVEFDDTPMILAAKFVRGPGDNGGGGSAFGAVPEPASMMLLGLGAIGLIRRHRKA